MLRKSFSFFQFHMGKYRGPLVAPTVQKGSVDQKPSSTNKPKHPLQEEVRRALQSNRSSGTSSATDQSALRLAQQIADRVANEDAAEERKRSSLYDGRLDARQQRRSGGVSNSTRRQQKDEEADELFEDEDGVDDDGVDTNISQFVPGGLSGRAAFEIPTLAPPAPPEAWVFRPQLLDANRMPMESLDLISADAAESKEENGEDDADAEQEEISPFGDIGRLLSPALAAALRRRCVDWNIKQPTPVQKMVLTAALSRQHHGEDERRDVCCISPTGTGKTLCYALPAIQTALECNGAGEDSTAMMTESRLRARDAARAAAASKNAEMKNVTCKYCGLNTRHQRVCPATGAPHPPVPTLMVNAVMDEEFADGDGAGDEEEQEQRRQQRAFKRSAALVSSRAPATPSSLILCPTNALVDQVHYVMRGLHCGLHLACLRTSTDEQTQKDMLLQLARCDILVVTPAMALVLLRKRRLSLKAVRFVAVDEIDHSLELPQYDLVNMVLAELPVSVTGQMRNRNILATASSSSRRNYYARSSSSSSPVGGDGDAIQVRRMLVGATLPQPLVPLAAKMLHPNKARWVVGSLIGDMTNCAPDAVGTNKGPRTGYTLTSHIPKGDVLTSKQPEQKQQQLQLEGENTSSQQQPPTRLDTFGGVTISTNITHSVIMVSRLEKTDKIRWLYDTGRIAPTQPTIIFCNHKSSVHFLYHALADSTLAHHNVRVGSLYSGQSEEARLHALKQFHQGTTQILLATDAYARGIDFPNVFAVIQYDFPSNFDVFVHRAGRCGRRGNSGRNFVLFEPNDARWARRLSSYLRQRRQDVPPLLAKYAKQSWADLYREQIQGLTLRRGIGSTNSAMHNSPLGRAENRFPQHGDTWKRGRFKASSD